jgi:hypothetical protein
MSATELAAEKALLQAKKIDINHEVSTGARLDRATINAELATKANIMKRAIEGLAAGLATRLLGRDAQEVRAIVAKAIEEILQRR